MISILYADDDPRLLESAQKFLEASGECRVDVCTSTRDALEILAEKRYDLVIVDLRMNGVDLLRTAPGSGDRPGVLFTVRDPEAAVVRARDDGADFYVLDEEAPGSRFAGLMPVVRRAVRRRRVEAGVRGLESCEAEIIDFLPDATFAIDTAGVVIAWNRAMEKMTGIRSEEILGKGDYEYAIPFYRERCPILIDIASKDDPGAAARYPFIRREGKTLFSEITIPHFNGGRGAALWFTASPIYDTQGRIIGAIESIRDITGWKRTIAALNESERQFRELTDLLPQVVFEADVSGLVTYANRMMFDSFGYSEVDQVNGINVFDLIAPIDRERATRSFADLLAGRRSQIPPLDVMARQKDGGTFPVSVYSSPIQQNGGITGVRGIIVDMTARARAEESVRESELMYRTVFEAMGTAGLLIENDATICLVNTEFERLSGYSKGEIEHKMKWTEFVAGEDPDQVMARHRMVGTDRASALQQYEFRFVTRSGEVRDIFVTVDIIPGTTTSFASLLDITERKKTEESVRRSLQEKEVLLKEIHHRVKNNLQSVWGLIDLQVQSIKDPAMIGTLRDSQNRIRVMSLIHETLYRSRDLSHIDVATYFRSLVNALVSTYSISTERIAISMDLEEIQMDVDTGIACGLIVNELVSNAFKHAFPGERKGEIGIEFRAEGAEYVLRFSDDGVGIPADFDPETSESLGLRLVGILANDQLDGSLRLIRGNGTTFVIRFPGR